MSFQLRPYQHGAVDAALDWMRRSIEPCLIDAAPAAGKSFMIAAIASELHRISGGKRILCLAPSAELVKQNAEKYKFTGEKCSIFSASAGAKSVKNVVVFGTPVTVKNSIEKFKRDYAAIIIDECHGLTPTIRGIIDEMRSTQPNLRVLGLSGTPYRMGSGYIFHMWPDGRSNGDDTTRDPYFVKCVYRVSAREMLDQGFITPMEIGKPGSSGYDTSGIELLPNGTLNHETVERAFMGHGRLTAQIVSDVINQSRSRPGGVMYFAATIAHAKEVLASLPAENSALVTGDMPTKERDAIIQRYRNQKIRHLVNVGTLTTGFDVSHTETIALLRYTESASLLQQIMGRAWRLHPGKDTSLLLDYANNIEEHMPDGDLYNPEIRAGKVSKSERIDAECPDCGNINQFSLNADYKHYQYDKHGYCIDEFGLPLISEHGPVARHFGRRCFGMVRTGDKGEYDRCGYYWTHKECLQCSEKNDVTARHCRSCKAELIDPNKKLVSFAEYKKNPKAKQCDIVLSMKVRDSTSNRGNKTKRVDFVTPYRKFSVWFLPDARYDKGIKDWQKFCHYTDGGSHAPHTIMYQKDESGYFKILGYDMPPDDEGNTK